MQLKLYSSRFATVGVASQVAPIETRKRPQLYAWISDSVKQWIMNIATEATDSLCNRNSDKEDKKVVQPVPPQVISTIPPQVDPTIPPKVDSTIPPQVRPPNPPPPPQVVPPASSHQQFLDTIFKQFSNIPSQFQNIPSQLLPMLPAPFAPQTSGSQSNRLGHFMSAAPPAPPLQLNRLSPYPGPYWPQPPHNPTQSKGFIRQW